MYSLVEREDNYLGFFNLISVHITGQGSSSFSFMNCEPCADDKVMYLSGFPWSYLDVCKLCQCCTKVKKFQALGIVSTQCKKTCWLVNLSSCNECLFLIILSLLLLVALVLLVTVCICLDDNDS